MRFCVRTELSAFHWQSMHEIHATNPCKNTCMKSHISIPLHDFSLGNTQAEFSCDFIERCFHLRTISGSSQAHLCLVSCNPLTLMLAQGLLFM